MKQYLKGVLQQLGILDKKNTAVKNLSGGQKQRVAIARALINEPRVILADEPTGALDSRTSDDVMRLLKDINSRGTTVIIVTHNQQIADDCQRTILLKDGKVVSDK